MSVRYSAVSAKFYFLGVWPVRDQPQWWTRRSDDTWTDRDWRRLFRSYLAPWCRYLCRVKLVESPP